MKFAFLFLILVVTHPSFAQDCSQAQSTKELEYCAQVEQAKTDEELNTVYQRVLASLEKMRKDPENRIKADLKNGLIKAQRLWVKFREADCQNVDDFWSEGTIRGLMYTSCMQTRAKHRIDELKEYEADR